MLQTEIALHCSGQGQLPNGLNDRPLFMHHAQMAAYHCPAQSLQGAAVSGNLQQLLDELFIISVILLADQVLQKAVVLRVELVPGFQETTNQGLGFLVDAAHVALDVFQHVVYLVLTRVEAVLQQYAGDV